MSEVRTGREGTSWTVAGCAAIPGQTDGPAAGGDQGGIWPAPRIRRLVTSRRQWSLSKQSRCQFGIIRAGVLHDYTEHAPGERVTTIQILAPRAGDGLNPPQ